MALTTEQQAMLDIQTATETLRHNNQMIIMTAQMKLDAIRLAQQTLVENARSKPADEREITPFRLFKNTITLCKTTALWRKQCTWQMTQT